MALTAFAAQSGCGLIDRGAPPELAPDATPVAVLGASAPVASGHEPEPEIRLVGLGRNDVQASLGSPGGEDERSPAKVWRYLQGDRAMDVYFCPDTARVELFTLRDDARHIRQ